MTAHAVAQTAYDVTQIDMGPAMLLVGVLALLLSAAVALRNPAALVVWGVSVLLLIFSGLYDLGFEWVWLSLLGTTILVVVGAIARWSM